MGLPAGGEWWGKLEAADRARGQVVREAFFGPARRRRGFDWRSILLHVPQAADCLDLRIFALSDAAMAPDLQLRVLGRREAAFRLAAQGWRSLPNALRGERLGRIGRIRAVLGQSALRRGQAPPYELWIDLYDSWGAADRLALAAMTASKPSIEVAVVAGASEAALAASRRSVDEQWAVPRGGLKVIRTQADWGKLAGAWILVLEAGEILAPHALACFAQAIERHPDKRGFLADLDKLESNGRRQHPSFRPSPDPWLLRSGFFAAGASVFHRDSHSALWPVLAADAQLARLSLARMGAAETLLRLPLILTHCPNLRHMAAMQVAIAEPAPHADLPYVSIIVPSACRSPHVLQCLRAVLRLTDYPCFEILLAVSQVDPADTVQASILGQASKLSHTRVVDLRLPVFNYATVNNKAASYAKGEVLLLLNDDVVPTALDWLRQMVSYTQEKAGVRAAIVGARLLYGNGMVQHAGVIMGLANLCEHGFRLAEREAIGPYGLAYLDREVSAVTAACMLVRRSLFESLGGFDESFAIALNDVDFCLRARASGARIVFAACIELYHFESVSLGRHYQGTRAGLEAIEVRQLRARWESVILADPFYNPCASLEPAREFQPAFPPRQTPQSWIGR